MEAIFRHLARQSTPARGRSEARTGTIPLAGRDEDLDELLAGGRKAAEGITDFLFVTGERGVGRSRLLAECARRCRPLGIRSFLLDAAPGALPWSLVRRLLSDLAKVFLGGRDPVAAVPPGLRPLLAGKAAATEHPGPVHGGLVSLLSGMSRIAPILILVDDFQNADPASLGALFYLSRVLLAKREEACRVAFILSAPDEAMAEGEMPLELMNQVLGMGGRRLDLARLTPEKTSLLLAAAFPGKELEARLPGFLYEKSQGNPLFACALIDLMRQDGSLDASGETVRLGETDRAELPGTVVELIRRRLAELDEKECRLVALASAGPRKIDIDFLTSGLGWGRSEVLRVLKGLSREGRLIQHFSGQYVFDPAIGRDVIRAELTLEAASRFHQLRAQFLETEHGGEPVFAMEIAEELDQAGRREQSAVYYLMAGRYLRRRFAFAACRRAFERYLELKPEASRERAEALVGVAEAMLQHGAQGDADAILSEALALCEQFDMQRLRGHTVMLSARRLFLEGKTRGALVSARLAEEILEATGEEALLGATIELKGEILNRQGDVEEAELAFEAALLLSTKTGDIEGRSGILLRLSRLAREQCRFDRALAYIEQALDTAREAKDEMREASVIHQAGLTRWMRGEHREGLGLMRQAVGRFQELANPRGEAMTLADIAFALGEEGKMADALAAATEARDLWRDLDDRAEEARAHAILAFLKGQSGAQEEAETFGRAAQMILEEVGDERYRGWVLAVLARVALTTNDVDAARRQATEALGIAERLTDYVTSGMALAVLGALHVRKRDLATGRELLERALTDLQAAGAATQVPEVRAAIGRVMVVQSHREEGIAWIRKAISEADRIGSAPARCATRLQLGLAIGKESSQGAEACRIALDIAEAAGLEAIARKIRGL